MRKIASSLSTLILSNLGKGRLFFLIAGIFFFIGGFAYWVISQLLVSSQANILLDLLPGYWPTTNSGFFKREFVAFIIIQAILAFICTIFFLFRKKLLRLDAFYISQYIFFILWLLSVSGSLFLRDGLLRLFPFISALFFSVALLNHESIKNYILSNYTIFFKKAIYLIKTICNKVNWHKFILLFSFLFLLVVLLPGFRAWYPLTLPNDYYEINNVFISTLSNQNEATFSFGEVQKFLEANRFNSPPPKGYGELFSAFDGLNGWTAETGRVLYHHSYVFVPAIHFIKYGLDNSIPYIYGYGNTILTALLMSTKGQNLSAYFFTYPISLLLGLLSISALVGYCSLSKRIFFIACFIGLYELYSVGFTAALLAASFNPIRYLGLSLQIAAVFFYFRSASSFRFLSLFISTLFSLFWNGEFGFIGMVSQILAILADKKINSSFSRAALISSLLFLPISYKFISIPSANILNSIYLGFFQINMPFLTGEQGVFFILFILLIQLLLGLMCFMFDGGQRLARLCVLPALLLSTVKIIYNPSSPHLAITLTFLLPFLLVYVPLESKNLLKREFLNRLIFFICILLLSCFCWLAGSRYEGESDFIRKYHIQPFELSSWESLGESMPFITREDQISNRVEAIQSKLRINEDLLILSPFDHLISFYVNPKNYCGHFEIISNLVIKTDIQKIASCVSKSKEILVVYDQALTMPCPDLKQLGLGNRCPQKLEVKKNVASVIDYLADLKEVGRSGSLIFYRKKSDNAN